MLAYRHAFHAGNHADVLKHTVLVAVLRYLASKDGRLTYIDTHAGAGEYSLRHRFAQQTAESRGGIESILAADISDPLLMDYMGVLVGERSLDASRKLRTYPGSPAIAARLLRHDDAMVLHERHPTDERSLRKLLAERARTFITLGDGFKGLQKALPPTPRRGLVLIDPSYEVKTDYPATVEALRDGLARFATGTFIVWFPLLQTLAAQTLPKRLIAAAAVAPKGWLLATVKLHDPDDQGFGLLGSGVLVVNPPFTLAASLRDSLQVMVNEMGDSASAGFALRESSP